MTRLTLLALAAGLAIAPAPSHAQVAFGNSATVLGDEILVGEPHHELRSGLLYVFRPEGGGWMQAQSLEAPDASPGDRFGISVAGEGSDLLVAATRAEGGAGTVYHFTRSGGNWQPAGRLVPNDRTGADSLGTGLALDGDWALVSSIAQGQGRGAVYAFRRSGGSWVQHSKLVPGDLQPEDRYGSRVALENGWALVSAPQKDDQAGAVYAFRYDEAADTWNAMGRLGEELGQPGAALGMSMALRDGRVYLGAPGLLAVGAVAEYALDAEGEAFRLANILLPFRATPGAGFGTDLTLVEDQLLVGAPGAGNGEGRAFGYRWDADLDEWTMSTMVSAADLPNGASFGTTVGGAGDRAVVGALGEDLGAGAAYVLGYDGGSWGAAQRIVSDVASVDAILGDEVRCSEDGAAALFDCSEVDMLSFLPVGELGANRGVRVNDVWGWTDPETGRDIAIVGMTDQTAFVDVSNPYQPTYLARMPLTDGANPSSWRDMKVYRDHTFVVSDGAGAHGMQVFDLTRLRDLDGGDPPTLAPDVLYDRIASAHNIVINEETGYAYAVGSSGGGETCGGGLHMINVQDPSNPTFEGCFQDPTTGRSRTGYSHDAQCVVYRGPDADYQGREICLGSNETALSIADVTDKDAPVAVAMATYPNVGYSHQGWFDDDHQYFYMNDELDETGGLVASTRTLVWDLTDLDDPILAKEHFSENQSSDHNLYIVGNTMYQSNYVSGLRILDISDRENPVDVGFFDTVPYGEDTPGFNGSWSNYPFFDSGVVVVTSGREGLFLVRPRARNLIP